MLNSARAGRWYISVTIRVRRSGGWQTIFDLWLGRKFSDLSPARERRQDMGTIIGREYVCDCGRTKVTVLLPAVYPYSDTGSSVQCSECGTYVKDYDSAYSFYPQDPAEQGLPNASDLLLAGVPGGGHGAGQEGNVFSATASTPPNPMFKDEDLGGTADAVPGSGEAQ